MSKIFSILFLAVGASVTYILGSSIIEGLIDTRMSDTIVTLAKVSIAVVLIGVISFIGYIQLRGE